ncbi:hypothetical protein KOY48_04855 [Candidatus Minimicrobia naudis]|uniref:Chaperone DnaJ C-terminal domain-containing protein n=1 Tax=Candidatus Minimicrobia naudis TaxID=2841263 RepID=A0A8F1SB49_9BACT|nr:hypothetical protein KOY48_04855 [Candidatus Minimicrobia naudis]
MVVEGDLYVHIRVSAHKKFTREGNIILSEEHISMVDASLGTEIDVGTVDGVITLENSSGYSERYGLQVVGSWRAALA